MLSKIHNKIYKKTCIEFSSVSRLELMGNYISHTGGKNISCLVSNFISLSSNVNKDCKINVFCLSNNEKIEFSVHDRSTNENNIKNIMLTVIEKLSLKFDVGFEIVLNDVDNMIGVNMDDSYILLFLRFFNHYGDLKLSEEQIYKIGREIFDNYQNEYISIFDYKKDNALYIDKRNDEEINSFINFEDFSLVVLYDKNFRSDLEFLFNERINDSISAHMIIDSKFKHDFLSDFKMHELNEIKEEVRDFEFKRIRHAITENNRVFELNDAIEKDDIVKIGILFNQSQLSLNQDYEITTQQQNLMCSLVAKYNVLGSKMISSKYNNAIFVLVKDLQVPKLLNEVPKLYKKELDSELSCVVCNIY